ncbi:immune inhibitor A domain-containing protein [Nocardioides sp. Bht2]|uniref:immune inhibitor A domain-containing protein n=1 Tax=Nocardioides sp. Bht2 TaxID=3392297 RepID=UPI0039B3C582
MKRVTFPALAALIALATQPLVAAGAHAGPTKPEAAASEPDEHLTAQADPHDRFDPRAQQRSNVRKAAVDELITGEAELKGKGADRTIARAGGSEVDYPVNAQARLLTFLVDFGTQIDPRYPSAGTGPIRGTIPEPAATDNSTYWKSDFGRGHYQEMFFTGLADQDGESMRHFYREASSGRYDLTGDVSDWVTVPYHQASYGTTENQTDMTRFISDSATAWYQAELTAGKSRAEIVDYLNSFDVWDRYDHDGDGDYNEPDGYIDHFQAVHAGIGEEAGGPTSAIWSHRWAANQAGSNGPSGAPFGGVEIGDTGIWIRDYTTEPENGGLGVFVHEYGHDLGLPDYYATASTDNGVGFWSAMASGSWLGHGNGSIGDAPGGFGASEKLQLGWYGPNNKDLALVASSDEASEVVLGPAHRATSTGKQALAVALPDQVVTRTGPFADSADGAYLYSGMGDNLTNSATSPVITLPEANAQLSAKIRYAIESGWDFAYLQVAPAGTAQWTTVITNRSTTTGTTNLGGGITGTSGWTTLTADLTGWAGSQVQLRWLYVTDYAEAGNGLGIDELQVGDLSTTFADGADGWTFDGFAATSANTYPSRYQHYYLAENRQYQGYDAQLRTGPYNFSATVANQVSSYPYQDGLLVWYSNSRYSENNTGLHLGYGANLPIDANPTLQRFVKDADQSLGNNSNAVREVFDATFDVDTMDAIGHSVVGQTLTVPARPSVPVFEDSNATQYMDTSNLPRSGQYHVRLPQSGAQIQVLSSDEQSGRMVVKAGSRFAALLTGPVVSGAAEVGATLTASTPIWFHDGTATSWQWLRDGEPITDATGSSYQLSGADAGRTVSATVTGTKSGYASTTTTSNGLAVPKAAAPVALAPPTITGTAKVGATLAVTAGDWPLPGSSDYRWSIEGTEIGTGPSLVVPAGTVGKQITVTETFSSLSAEDATATAVSAVIEKGAAPLPDAVPRISGTAKVGNTLKAVPGSWPTAGATSRSWRIDGVEVGTAPSLKLTRAHAGKQIELLETFTSDDVETALATATSARVAKAPSAFSAVQVKLRSKKAGKLSFKVTSAGAVPTGKVTITVKGLGKAGKRIKVYRGTVTVRGSKLTVKLPKRAKGRYQLTLSYRGDYAATSLTKRYVVRSR